jgi:hypothetical protein
VSLGSRSVFGRQADIHLSCAISFFDPHETFAAIRLADLARLNARPAKRRHRIVSVVS